MLGLPPHWLRGSRAASLTPSAEGIWKGPAARPGLGREPRLDSHNCQTGGFGQRPAFPAASAPSFLQLEGGAGWRPSLTSCLWRGGGQTGRNCRPSPSLAGMFQRVCPISLSAAATLAQDFGGHSGHSPARFGSQQVTAPHSGLDLSRHGLCCFVPIPPLSEGQVGEFPCLCCPPSSQRPSPSSRWGGQKMRLTDGWTGRCSRPPVHPCSSLWFCSRPFYLKGADQHSWLSVMSAPSQCSHHPSACSVLFWPLPRFGGGMAGEAWERLG